MWDSGLASINLTGDSLSRGKTSAVDIAAAAAELTENREIYTHTCIQRLVGGNPVKISQKNVIIIGKTGMLRPRSMLPPGECNGMIPVALPIYFQSVITIVVIVFL